jgi:hypothetical protein
MRAWGVKATIGKRVGSLAFWLLAGVLSMLAALTVSPLTANPERVIFSRADRNTDTLFQAVDVSNGVDKLLSDPFNYYTRQYLYPDHNQLRLTDTFLSEALLAAPLRILFSDKWLLIASLARIFTVILTALATMLMLREFGVGRWAAITGGLLAVLVSNYGIHIDRIQTLSLQWPALAVFFAVRLCKGKNGLINSVGLAASLFLLVHSSIYTAVMLVSLVPFFIPVFVTGGRGVPGYWRKVAALTLVTATAALLVATAMWPWLTDRWDLGAYLEKEFREVRRFNTSCIGPLIKSPPEFINTAMPLMPAVRYDGYYPGHALILAVLGVVLFGIASRADRQKADIRPPPTQPRGKGIIALYRCSGFLTAVAGSLTAIILGSWAFGFRPLQINGLLVDVLIWGTLAGWVVKLACWPQPWSGGPATKNFLGSASFLAATVLFLLAQGSPIRNYATGPVIANGIFGPESLLFPPLGELRFLYRITATASLFLIAGLALRLDMHAKAKHERLVPVFSAFLIIISFAGWIGAGFGEVASPALPEGYSLLKDSSGRGGLLELPLPVWTSHLAVYRIVWQREYGRSIVDGSSSLEPPWFAHAREVLNSFPSQESIWLLRRWKVGSVLAQSDFLKGGGTLLTNKKGVVFEGSRGGMVLFDIDITSESHGFRDDQLSDSARWLVPHFNSPAIAARLSDRITFHTKSIVLKSGQTLDFRIDPGDRLEAVMIDYGFALGAEIPSSLKVLAELDGEWRDITKGRTGGFLRSRTADLLLNRKPAKLVIEVKQVRATRFRLHGYRASWQLPELRVMLGRSQGNVTSGES